MRSKEPTTITNCKWLEGIQVVYDDGNKAFVVREHVDRAMAGIMFHPNALAVPIHKIGGVYHGLKLYLREPTKPAILYLVAQYKSKNRSLEIVTSNLHLLDKLK